MTLKENTFLQSKNDVGEMKDLFLFSSDPDDEEGGEFLILFRTQLGVILVIRLLYLILFLFYTL